MNDEIVCQIVGKWACFACKQGDKVLRIMDIDLDDNNTAAAISKDGQFIPFAECEHKHYGNKDQNDA